LAALVGARHSPFEIAGSPAPASWNASASSQLNTATGFVVGWLRSASSPDRLDACIRPRTKSRCHSDMTSLPTSHRQTVTSWTPMSRARPAWLRSSWRRRALLAGGHPRTIATWTPASSPPVTSWFATSHPSEGGVSALGSAEQHPCGGMTAPAVGGRWPTSVPRSYNQHHAGTSHRAR
jgi:hypothetical protein